MEYDLAIVGAGPAGSTVARVVAEKNADVILLEKRTEIGAPKRCGEGLSISALNKGNLKPKSEWISQKIKGVFVYAPSGKRVEARYKNAEGITIERKIFDKYLAALAADAGALVKTGVRITSLLKQGNKISGITVKNSGDVSKIKANIVIAADGVESKTARWAGINTTLNLSDVCAGAQFEMAGLSLEDESMLEVYMGNKIAPGGYIWVFPKRGGRANVGIGIRANKTGPAIDYLKKFVDNSKILSNGSIVEINGGAIPVGGPVSPLVLDGFMVVGDAAHQVNAIHGGGVGEAMRSGILAGTVAAQAVEKQDFSSSILSQYEKEWSSTEGKRLSKLVKLRKIVESLTDDELNYLADELKGDDIIDLAKAKKYQTLVKILAKKPSLIRLIPKLF